MDAIAAEAGVSKLTVYGHFLDKDALFRAVIAEKCGSLSPPERFQQLADDGPERRLMRIAEGFTELMAHPDVIAMHRPWSPVRRRTTPASPSCSTRRARSVTSQRSARC